MSTTTLRRGFQEELGALIERAYEMLEIRRVRIPDHVRDKLYAMQKGRCAACGKRLILSNCHCDHIVPLALGGTSDIRGLQLLHPICNLKKGSLDTIDWARSLGRLL